MPGNPVSEKAQRQEQHRPTDDYRHQQRHGHLPSGREDRAPHVPQMVRFTRDVEATFYVPFRSRMSPAVISGPYSPRAAFGAPVSVPITWDELDDPGLRPDRWTVRGVLDRLAKKGDPFRSLLGAAQELPEIT
jgi:DNA primase